MQIVFFGPPGSGKGTQAKLIAKSLNILHLSTGDILREKLNEKDELSEKLKFIMSSGNLVSDGLLNEIIANKITSADCSKGFILDGYPRTLTQSDFLLSFLKINKLKLNYIFDFKLNFNIVEERIIKRSKQESRPDDTLSVIKTRLDKYVIETSPISDIFKDKFTNNYFSIDASLEISIIQKELLNIIKNGEN